MSLALLPGSNVARQKMRSATVESQAPSSAKFGQAIMNGGGTCDGWAGSQNIKTIHVMAIMPFIKVNSNKFLPYNLIRSLGTCTIAI
ncbi:hypothetical protein NL676_036103 [Syzygium grande]|nr:hypothetical protein NL676_036103 [Syzygium grande]